MLAQVRQLKQQPQLLLILCILLQVNLQTWWLAPGQPFILLQI
jgi:hypothetical protein